MSRPTSFYYAFLALPRDRREAIIAVWDFCRAVDDTVDDIEVSPGRAMDAGQVRDARERLAGWRAELERCYTGQPETAAGRRLQPWIRAHDLSKAPFADLIDGVEMDLDRTEYPTFEALHEYCWRVASTVGLICIEIFGARSAAAREYAVTLGVALQLTNIIRDVRQDAARGRVYIPGSDLRRFGCAGADLDAARPSPAVRALLAYECARAHDYYRRAHALLPRAERRPLVAAQIMAAIYRELLHRVERADHDVFSTRIAVPRARQASIALTTWIRVQAGLDGPA